MGDQACSFLHDFSFLAGLYFFCLALLLSAISHLYCSNSFKTNIIVHMCVRHSVFDV